MSAPSLAVKLGYLENLLFSDLPKVSAFSSEKHGGDKRDRTVDLLHAMPVQFPLSKFYKTLYLCVFAKFCYCSELAFEALIPAHKRSKTKTIDGVRGGKIGVRQGTQSRSIFETNLFRPKCDDRSKLSSARSFLNLNHNIKNTFAGARGRTYEENEVQRP